MPPRYITNVTPASYIAETAVANLPAESGLSDIGTIMRPASHMSPSMGDYGWPGSDGSSVNPTLMLPLSEMSPTADSFAQSEAGSSEQSQLPQQEQPPWMAALQSLYGQQQGNDDMPLAVPYGAFAVPSEFYLYLAGAWLGAIFPHLLACAGSFRRIFADVDANSVSALFRFR